MKQHVAWNDSKRDHTTLTKVDGPHKGWYDVTRDDGWSCCISAEYGVIPKVGDAFVSWGGVGHIIRGMALNGHVLYYRTAAQQDLQNKIEAEARHAEKVAAFEAKRSEHDARVAQLSEPLRKRIEGFHAFRGDNWRWEFEPYEMACCEEAQRLHAAFPDGEALKRFAKLSHEQQKLAYPQMSDDHSGNTWGFSLRLAYHLSTNPELVPQEHGALCPLVGCNDYGCFACR